MNARPIHWLVAIAVVLAVSACAGSESYDPDDTRALQSHDEAVRDRAASDLCRSELGPEALFFWTPEGHLVCRRGKPLI
jgi:hypothetical protein